jgi:hypothetical protein
MEPGPTAMESRRMTSTFGRIAAGAVAVAAIGCTHQAAAPPFQPVATVLELMESVIAHAAEEYWDSVSIVINEAGVTENYPETDEEWEGVWAAAMSLAESGNLLMMPPRAVDDGPWMRYSAALVDVGVEAAAAAAAKDPDRVLAVGERVYNVCLDCHARYVAQ